MFATIVGTNTGKADDDSLFMQLTKIAINYGYQPPDTNHRARSDQNSLDGWIMDVKGPAYGESDFVIAVISPLAPSISPLPCAKTIEGPLFAVNVMDSYFIISRADHRDVSECKDQSYIISSFKDFLKSISKTNSDDAKVLI